MADDIENETPGGNPAPANDEIPSFKQTPYPDPVEHYMALGQHDRFIDLRTKRYGLSVTNMQDIIFMRSFTTLEGPVSFGTHITSQFLVTRDFAKMFLTEAPGPDWFEVTPTQNEEDGRWYQTWEKYIPTPEEVAAEFEGRRQATYLKIKETLVNRKEGGVAVDFGPTYGVLHLQIRDTDRINMLGLKDEADDLIRDNKANDVMIVRTSENINVEITAYDFVNLSRGYREIYKAMMAWSWHWSDQVRLKEIGDEFPEIPTSIELETIVAGYSGQPPATE